MGDSAWSWKGGLFSLGILLMLAGCGADSAFDDSVGNGAAGSALTVAITPSDGATGVESTAPVTAIFNQEIDPETVKDGNLYLYDENDNLVPGTFSFDENIKRIVFQPTEALGYATTYRFAVSRDVVSVTGDTLPAEAISRFSTMAVPVIKAAVVTIAPEALTVDTNDSELLGGIFGALLGMQIGVDALAAEQLAEVTISLDNFVAEAAGTANASTVEELLNSGISVASVLEIISDELGALDAEEAQSMVVQLIDAVNAQGTGDVALLVGEILQIPADMHSMQVHDLLALKGFSDAHLGSIQLLGAVNNALQPVLMRPVELPLALPALSDAESTVRVQVMTPAKSAVMELGDTIGSSSTRLQLDLSLGRDLFGGLIASLNGLLGIPGTVEQAIVNVPLYVEVGQAGAEVTAISSDGITLEGKTAVAKLFIGQIPEEQFFSQTLLEAGDFEPVNLIDAGGLLTVSIKAYAVGEGRPVQLDYAPVNQRQVQTMKSAAGSDVNALLGTLVGDLELTVTLLGISVDVSDLLGELKGPLLQTVFPLVGELLNAQGGMLGISTGASDVILESVIYE